MEEKKPTEDDYAMMLKRIAWRARHSDDPVLQRMSKQARDLLKRGGKFNILRGQHYEQ